MTSVISESEYAYFHQAEGVLSDSGHVSGVAEEKVTPSKASQQNDETQQTSSKSPSTVRSQGAHQSSHGGCHTQKPGDAQRSAQGSDVSSQQISEPDSALNSKSEAGKSHGPHNVA